MQIPQNLIYPSHIFIKKSTTFELFTDKQTNQTSSAETVIEIIANESTELIKNYTIYNKRYRNRWKVVFNLTVTL